MKSNLLHDKKKLSSVLAVLIALLAFSTVFASGRTESSEMSDSIFSEPAAPAVSQDQGVGTLIEMQNSFRSVAQKVLPVVVEVDVVDVVTRTTGDRMSPFNFFSRPRGQDDSSTPQEFRRAGLGSGVIVYRSNGSVYVLTNYHVAGEADEISVTLYDGRKFNAALVGGDAKRDLALLVIETDEDIPVAELGDSSTLMVGDWALAIGNPYGFEATVTAGIVSAIHRETASAGGGGMTYTDYIQTDAAINQGNSGGALVNIYGQVVGINTWIASPSGGSIGIGFAIPINNAKKVVEDLIRDGEIRYGWLGITVGDANESYRKDLNIGEEKGGFVFGVIDGSPADKAGILAGDFITKIGDTKIDSMENLIVTVANLGPGTELVFEMIRGGEKISTDVTIAVRDDERLESGKDKVWPGFSAVTLTDELRERFQIPEGAGNIVVSGVDENSAAAVAGLRRGDIISSMNGRALDDVSDVYEIVNDSASKSFALELTRNGQDFGLEFRR